MDSGIYANIVCMLPLLEMYPMNEVLWSALFVVAYIVCGLVVYF